MSIKKDFGLRIKDLRNKKGITQYQLAEIAGIDPKHMSHIETGRSFPKSDLIEKLAFALGVEYPVLFETEYLQDRKVLLCKINEYLQKATDKNLQIIYRLISSYME